jgi:hypothetical protein
MLDSTTATELAGLTALDHLTLQRLVFESLWRVDHGQGDTVYELWADDGEIWYDGKLFCSGIDAIKEWGQHRLPPDSIRHVAGNLRFDADGPDAAVGTGVEFVFHAESQREGPEATLPLMVGDWEFRFARTAAGWRFQRINFQRRFDRRVNPGELS